MKNLRAASAAFLILVVAPSWVWADGGQLRFAWRAPDVCPTRERVLARAEELLGRAPESTLTSALELDAQLAQKAAGSWQLELRSRTEAGQTTTRSVMAASCAELADAAALLLALAIDPALSARAGSQSSAFQIEPDPAAQASSPSPPSARLPLREEPSSPPAPELAAPADLVASPVQNERATAPLRPRAGAAFAVWSRRLPGMAPGVLAQAGISRGAGFALACLGFFPARHATVPEKSAGGDLSLFSFGAEAGYAVAVVPERFELSPVLGGELDWVRGVGTGVAHPAHGSLLLVGLSGGARAALRLSPGWVVFGQGLISALVARPRFVLDGVGELYRPPAWGLRFGLGAEWRPP